MRLIFYILFNFIFYSFIGWIIEGLYSFATTKKFKKEGFLNTPFKPMYGIAVTILVIYKEILLIKGLPMLVLCFLIPTTIEYISGYLLKHVFNKVYWDYSSLKYNINGYVTLKFSMYWTLLSLVGICYVQPVLTSFYINYENVFLQGIVFLIFLVIIFDVCITIKNFLPRKTIS